MFAIAAFADNGENVMHFARHPPTLPGVPTGTCTPTQLHGVHVRHATSAHCCSGLSGGAHGGVPSPPHTAGSADATPASTQASALIEAATAPIISSRSTCQALSFVIHVQGIAFEHGSCQRPAGGHRDNSGDDERTKYFSPG